MFTLLFRLALETGGTGTPAPSTTPARIVAAAAWPPATPAAEAWPVSPATAAAW